jgi:2-phospho-L-lactate guanylyltransferase
VLGDRDGTGTALLTAMPGHAPRPAYGEGSFARHIEAGHVPLAVPAHHSPLWHDIDTPADLMRALEGVADDVHGIGPRTREALARIALDTP